MKVLFIGNYREQSGFGVASIGYIKALLTTGHDIVCRCFYLGSSNAQIPEEVIQCEKKSLDNVEVVIQHLLPHNMSYIPNVKNIGICVNDTSSLKSMEWDRYLNLMDEVWVPQDYNPPFLQELTVPVKYVPHAFDTEKYKKTIEPLNINEVNGTCIFYTIADLNIRKNVRDTIIAYHSEFSFNEPTTLLLKISKSGMSHQESFNIVSQSINSIKSDLKLYPNPEDYRKELIITQFLPEEQLEKIHATGFAYVNTSHGEGWCIPQFDAWAYGNRVIYYTSDKYNYSYLKLTDTKFKVECKTTNILGYKDTFQQLGTAREEWNDSNIIDLRKKMREVYNEWLNDKEKIKHCRYENYSYKEVGILMESLLND